MRYLTTVTLTAAVVAALAGCDDVGDASPACQMQIVGGQLDTPPGGRPWIALWITGDASCVEGGINGIASDVRVSMYDTHPATYYRGDGLLSSVKPIGNTTLCAVYKWPAFEGEAKDWSVVVTPPARTDTPQPLPRALGLVPSQVSGLQPGIPAPFWLVADEFVTYPITPTNVAGCWPGYKP